MSSEKIFQKSFKSLGKTLIIPHQETHTTRNVKDSLSGRNSLKSPEGLGKAVVGETWGAMI